jgi:hypothetical protein
MVIQTTLPKSIAKFTTPQVLKIGLYITWGASALLLWSAIAAIQTQRHGLDAVTQKAIPNVFMAQRLKTAMTDIDSIVANQLLEPSLTMSKVDQENYDTRRGDLSERIVLAAQNISLGDAEEKPLQTIVLKFNDYMAQAERARFAKERGDQVAMLAAYRQATQILDETLLPSADEFARVNEAVLKRSYAEAQMAGRLSVLWIAASGVLLISALIVLQLFLSQRTRRTFNPLLLAATAIAVLFLSHTAVLMSTSSTLSFLKQDVYASIRALRLGRVQIYQANGAKSRYLLDRVLSSQHETSFNQHADKMLKLTEATSLDAVIKEYQDWKPVSGVTGYFADALQNTHSAEERAALLTMLKDYQQYLQIAQQIRQLAVTGQREAAISLSTGRELGQSYWAFDQLRDSNEKAREIYVAVFNQVTTDSFRSLDGFELRATISVLAIALLILFGLRPRLREYFL